MSSQIRAAGPEEWRRVRDLRLRALADSPEAFGSTLEREREAGEAQWLDWISGWEGAENALFVAEEGAAWLGLAVGSHEAGRDHTHLYAMWVEPASRHRAFGTRLVEAVVEWSRSRGVRTVELGVTETNADARAFYEHLGFEEAGERQPLREDSPLLVIVMQRTLAAG